MITTGDRETNFKDFHREALDAKGIKQLTEARHLKKSQSFVSNILDTESPYYLGVHQIPDSTVSNDIIGWLANEMNFSFIPHTGKLNKKITDELAGITAALSEILKDPTDRAMIAKQSTIIAELAENMKLEEENANGKERKEN